MSPIGLPARDSISVSVSMKETLIRWARASPTVDFPAPGAPTRTAIGVLISTGPSPRWRRLGVLPDGQTVDVTVQVAARLGDGVAAKLLQRHLSEHQGHHRLGEHTR